MDEKKKMELTRLQGGMAIASFSAGVGIALGCLFFIEPLGEFTNSAIAIVSQPLVLCGAILGVKASYDVMINKMAAEIRNVERRTGIEPEETE